MQPSIRDVIGFGVASGALLGAFVVQLPMRIGVGASESSVDFFDLSGDPKTGTPIPFPPFADEPASRPMRDKDGLNRVRLGTSNRLGDDSQAAGPRFGDILVAFVGSCSGCTRNALRLDLSRDRSFAEFVLIHSAPAAGLPSEWNGLEAPYRIVADQDGSLARRLNALWEPRFYLYGPDRRLRSVQRAPGPIEAFLEEALHAAPSIHAH